MKGPAEVSQHIQYTGLIYKMFRDQQKTASIYSTLVLQDVKGPAEDSQRIQHTGIFKQTHTGIFKQTLTHWHL